ncbi:Hypothetical_protein [Hexamita inflata]|uniref:Hypothetical_protein n=1 Tax=Hexamita inflata TaxID=28002 RepID=A0AA86Q2B2_9EUKA|nr:Hypothetical protein HINF_LOCUS21871 [Hexamita inflata]CAI9950626.1 Hypothetical protein HINF_LOCUS38271 [Hexamita inflata]CAI9951991.1 Hypothetical protein HINF_LOCUS39636 [Hexamita inflata]
MSVPALLQINIMDADNIKQFKAIMTYKFLQQKDGSNLLIKQLKEDNHHYIKYYKISNIEQHLKILTSSNDVYGDDNIFIYLTFSQRQMFEQQKFDPELIKQFVELNVIRNVLLVQAEHIQCTINDLVNIVECYQNGKLFNFYSYYSKRVFVLVPKQLQTNIFKSLVDIVQAAVDSELDQVSDNQLTQVCTGITQLRRSVIEQFQLQKLNEEVKSYLLKKKSQLDIKKSYESQLHVSYKLMAECPDYVSHPFYISQSVSNSCFQQVQIRSFIESKQSPDQFYFHPQLKQIVMFCAQLQIDKFSSFKARSIQNQIQSQVNCYQNIQPVNIFVQTNANEFKMAARYNFPNHFDSLKPFFKVNNGDPEEIIKMKLVLLYFQQYYQPEQNRVLYVQDDKWKIFNAEGKELLLEMIHRWIDANKYGTETCLKVSNKKPDRKTIVKNLETEETHSKYFMKLTPSKFYQLFKMSQKDVGEWWIGLWDVEE